MLSSSAWQLEMKFPVTSNTRKKVHIFLRNVINTQGNKDNVQFNPDFDDEDNDLFNATKNHHGENTGEANTRGVKSYAYQLDSKKISVVPIFADNELRENTAFEMGVALFRR
jgi:hypothetical protein